MQDKDGELKVDRTSSVKEPAKLPPPGIPYGEGDDSDDERKDTSDYHRPYMHWMMDPKSKPPDMWDAYLSNKIHDNVSLVNNPHALAHLALFYAKENNPPFRTPCPSCDQENAQSFWYARCPKCSKVHVYPKHTIGSQQINCQECNISFPTSNDTFEHCAAFCPDCKQGL